jgi:lysozyme family protein
VASFDKAILHSLKWEGGYVNDPSDSGGETKYGISKKSFPDVDIKNLTLDEAKNIYLKNYWNPLYTQIKDESLAIKLFDLGINLGVAKAVILLQKAIYNYETITMDGKFGNKTLSLVNKYSNLDLYNAYIDEVKFYYNHIVAKNPKNVKFLRGWLNRLRHKP